MSGHGRGHRPFLGDLFAGARVLSGPSGSTWPSLNARPLAKTPPALWSLCTIMKAHWHDIDSERPEDSCATVFYSCGGGIEVLWTAMEVLDVSSSDRKRHRDDCVLVELHTYSINLLVRLADCASRAG